MQGLEAEGRVAADAAREVLDRRSLLLQELAQRRAARELHHEIGRLEPEHRQRLDAVDRRDVRVPHALPELAFGDETRLRLRVLQPVLAQELHRHLGALVEPAVRRREPRAVDRARRAAAEFLQQREAAGHQQPGGRGGRQRGRLLLRVVAGRVVARGGHAELCSGGGGGRRVRRPCMTGLALRPLAPRRASRHAARFRCRSASTTR